MAAHDMTFQDVMAKNALARPDETAFVYRDASRTFAQYERDTLRLAAGLATLGVVKGDRIAVVAFNCYEFFLMYGASAQLGAVVVAINWRLSPEEIGVILRDCAPIVVVACGDYVVSLAKTLDTCRSVEHRLVIGTEVHGFRPVSDVASCWESFQPVQTCQSDPFVIIYTAAVEGRPRGAVLTHGNIVAASLQVIVPMEISAADVYLNLMPLFHVMGLELAMAVMYAGGRNVILNKFDPAEAVQWIERERVTMIPTVPPMLSGILDKAEDVPQGLKTLRVIPSLFDHPDTIRRCQQITSARYWSGFGQTENMGYLTLCPYDDRPGSSGRAGPMVRVQVVDDYDRPVPVGQAGEIVAKGPVIFREYWNLKEETLYALREGWLHTGDVGRLDEKGYLWYIKRKAEKELIKPGGENVYPMEVEKALLAHDDVLEACVFGVPDREWGEAVKAVCVLKTGSRLKPQELIDFVSTRIARYKKPKFVAFAEALPRTEDGAVSRERVKAEFSRS
jgi:long-chain acyl-CoA synthetase